MTVFPILNLQRMIKEGTQDTLLYVPSRSMVYSKPLNRLTLSKTVLCKVTKHAKLQRHVNMYIP